MSANGISSSPLHGSEFSKTRKRSKLWTTRALEQKQPALPKPTIVTSAEPAPRQQVSEPEAQVAELTFWQRFTAMGSPNNTKSKQS